MEHLFTTYVRTKTLYKRRLKDLKDYDTVKIYQYELEKFNVNNGPFLFRLKRKGEIDYDSNGNFKALRDGPINFELLEKGRKKPKVSMPLSPLHKYMRDELKYVEIDVDKKDIPVYFKAFLDHRDKQMNEFFTVDEFAGRVHTPVVNIKGELRLKLKFHGSDITSLDVKQMQPTILGKVLYDCIGNNPFSDAIFRGEDVYMLLLRQNRSISTRPEAKKLLFQLIFGRPMERIGTMFHGDTNWVDWINHYKSTPEKLNPHKEDKHTNLAWLLQYSEVQVMTDIWKVLMQEGIHFLTIHDDILCKEEDKDRVYAIMKQELGRHFRRFKINVNHSS